MDGSAGRYWQLHFDENARASSPSPSDIVQEVTASGASDLFVMSHGWGNSQQDADKLFATMFPLIASAATVPASARYLGIYWPSLWFPDPPAAEVAASSPGYAAKPEPGLVDAALTGKAITEKLAASVPEADRDRVARMGALVDEGLDAVAKGEDRQAQQRRLEEFHGLLTSVFAAATSAVEDSGESALLSSADPQRDYQDLARTMGSAADLGDVQGLGDLFTNVWNGAKDALRVASYFQMKARAGTVGKDGLGPFLTALKGAAPQVRVHLIGHSFGARLVAFSLSGIPDAATSPVASLTLLQGAFSHWSFSDGSSGLGIQGALVGLQDRVHGPLCATFSSADWAVGRWYPRASFLAQQDNQNVESDPRWGGMGADGYQGVAARSITLPLNGTETFTPGEFHRVDANLVINDTSDSAFAGAHSDICKPAVAALVGAAAAATIPG
ncbi:MAG: hypothetical protein ACOYBY_12130 [Dermatophilaceae bacterium]